MGIVAIALRFFGFAANVLTVGQFLEAKVREATDTDAEGLFKRCFRSAVQRNRRKLAHFTQDRDPQSVQVDEDGLNRAIVAWRSADAVSALPSDKAQVGISLAPAFQHALILPGHQLTERDIDREIANLLEEALSDFFTQLPAARLAMAQSELDHMLRVAEDHQCQTLALGELQRQLDEIHAAQDQLIGRLTFLDPTVLQRESSRPEHRNPFRIVKAEEFDHDYARLAALFRQPSDYDDIRSPDNLILAGRRGCGKSMILRSLSVPAAVEIERLRRDSTELGRRDPFGFVQSGLKYFGVYIKLARGYFYEWAPDCRVREPVAVQLFQHVFNVQLLRYLIDALDQSRGQAILQIADAEERSIVEHIDQMSPFEVGAPTFSHLRSALLNEENCVCQYMGDLRLSEPRPTYNGTHTSIHNYLDEACKVVTQSVHDLKGCRIFFLLDEYENLALFQQQVVNTLAKLRPFSLTLKLATRSLGIKSIRDLQGEQIQHPRDYHLVLLDYDVQRADYRELLVDIAGKRLEAERFTVTDISALLPGAPQYHPSSQEKVTAMLNEILRSRTVSPDQLSDQESKEQLHHWATAAVFRSSDHRRRPFTYAGLGDFVELSSGTVSTFLELCKMAFYLAQAEGVNVRSGAPIPWSIQNKAVYHVSTASLNQIARNIENTGPAISRLILDLADVFREKLLHHHSEPEAARLVLKDPSALDQPQHKLLAAVLDDAVRWGVLHAARATNAYFPKHRTDVRSDDYLLNRTLAPALRLSPRPRWRTEFRSAELTGLLALSTRVKERNALRKKHGAANRDAPLFGAKGGSTE